MWQQKSKYQWFLQKIRHQSDLERERKSVSEWTKELGNQVKKEGKDYHVGVDAEHQRNFISSYESKESDVITIRWFIWGSWYNEKR